MNLSTGEFVVLCVISFIAGVALIAWLGSVNENANARRELENERLRKERDEAFNAAVTQFSLSSTGPNLDRMNLKIALRSLIRHLELNEKLKRL